MINQVTLVGRLTRDPELRTTSEGTPVTHITLAVNRSYRNSNGEVDVDFVQCTLWRGSAENICRYCRKGSVIAITGRLQSRHYEKDGKRVYVTEVVAETTRFLGPKLAVEGSRAPAPVPSQAPGSSPAPVMTKEELAANLPF